MKTLKIIGKCIRSLYNQLVSSKVQKAAGYKLSLSASELLLLS